MLLFFAQALLTDCGPGTATGPPAGFAHIRFTPKRLRSYSAGSVQLSELQLFAGSKRLQLSRITNPKGRNPEQQKPPNLIDGNVTTKWLDFNKAFVILDLQDSARVDRYRLATADDCPERDPLDWTLEGRINSSEIWYLLDAQTNFAVPTNRTTFTPLIEIAACYPCPQGQYSNTSDNEFCEPFASCAAGFGRTGANATRSSSCVACARGRYSLGGDMIECNAQTPCGPGLFKYVNPNMSSISNGACTICPKGQYKAGSNLQPNCTQCSPGRYAKNPYMSLCWFCPMGMYQPDVGQPSCSKCSLGWISQLGSSSCTACAPGKFRSQPMSTVCSACPAGYYAPGWGHNESCTAWPKGYSASSTYVSELFQQF